MTSIDMMFIGLMGFIDPRIGFTALGIMGLGRNLGWFI